MPPPTAHDEWLSGRQFGIVIDAGSSGSRLQLYNWRDARIVRAEQGAKVYRSLLKIEKGTQNADDWVHKVEPGISSFADQPEDVANYLAPLLDHARQHIPPSLHSETPIFLLATAGMRLLPPTKQATILDAACDFIRSHTTFRVDTTSGSERCGSSVRIITGEEEGLFGWVAVNYLMDQFTSNNETRTTYGFLDMGGASTQIAFEPSLEDRKNAQGLIDVTLRTIGGEEFRHQVFVSTWLGYGTNQARERYVGHTIALNEIASGDLAAMDDNNILDPCLPRDLILQENTHYAEHNQITARTLVGTGSYEECLERVLPLLNKDAPCSHETCLFDGVYVPRIDFSVSHFIGVSEYWYSSEDVFGLGGAYNFVEFERAASKFCSRSWVDILRQHEYSRQIGALGGDGEVEEDGEVVDMDKWGEAVEIPRLQMQCFKSAWLVNVLHNGIGLPRIVDPGGNSDDDSGLIESKASQKGLGRPLLQSMNSIGDTSISWTLGKMVLEASLEIPLLSSVRPKPAQEKNFDGNSDITVDDSELSNLVSGQEFFPIGTFSYVICILLLLIIAYRLRCSILYCMRRSPRRSSKRARASDDARVLMEEGHNSSGGRASSKAPFRILSSLTSASRLWLFMRSVASTTSRVIRIRSPNSQNPTLASTHQMHSSTFRVSPNRLISSPSLRSHFSGSSVGATGPSTAAAASAPAKQHGLYSSDSPYTSNITLNGSPIFSRASTPPTFRMVDVSQSGNGVHANDSLYSLPRSRNNSRMNLTTLVTRQPLSRTGSSGQVSPTMILHNGE